MNFSIIIPSYNRALQLSKAIGSVLTQTFSNWELIIVDDGSTDNTKEIIESFQDSRIIYLYQANAERSAARNNGIKNAKGEWICFLDSDDEFLSDHLANLAEMITGSNAKAGLICTGLIRIEKRNENLKPFLNLSGSPIIEIAKHFLIPTQVCIHRSILLKDKFDVRFRLWEDTHLWMRIVAKHPVYQIEKYTCIQNIHDESTVVKGMKQVNIKDVDQYIVAINDLQLNYNSLFERKFTKTDFINYRDSKYRMYLYQARKNKQLSISLLIWTKGMLNQPSGYLITEFPKIFLNKIGIRYHGK